MQQTTRKPGVEKPPLAGTTRAQYRVQRENGSDGRARSAMESMRRRQLEARQLAESNRVAGVGTYQYIRPARGRELAGPRPNPPRLPTGSNSYGTVQDLPPALPRAPAPRMVHVDEDRTMIVAARLWEHELTEVEAIAPRSGWILPIGLAAVLSTAIIAIALILR